MVYKKTVLMIFSVFIVFAGITLSRPVVLENTRNLLAATFFIPSISMGELRAKYVSTEKTGEKIKILLVPGHEPNFGGTEFGNLKERDINVDLAMKLKDNLERNKHFEVILTRDKERWNPELEKYFNDNWEAIRRFTKIKKTEMRALVSEGKVEKVTNGVKHNTAPDDVAYRLFGINRWSRDINADVLIHIHFNDYPRRRADLPGKHRGFVIYIPDRQYSNAVATKEIAKNIFERLEEFFVVSDLPKEDAGIVESQDLIAIGQSNSLDAASLLIEYGYIYRAQFTSKNLREEIFDQMAELTYLGLEDSLK